MKNILDTIGNTPLLKIEGIYAKFEAVNPSGSIKDRMAKYIMAKAEERGELKPGSYIVEATSGNTGVSFSMLTAIKGYKMIAVMPQGTSIEKIKMMEAFGTKVVLTPKKDKLGGAIKETERLARKYKKVWLPRQFKNPDNIKAHETTTGKEILKQIAKVDVFVAGIGTGGTLMGVAKALKKKFPQVKIIGVEAVESPHQIEGISDGIVPEILDFNLIDEIVKIRSQDAISMAKKLAKKYGLMVGISSGANVLASLKLNRKYKNVVTVLPDRAERYPELW